VKTAGTALIAGVGPTILIAADKAGSKRLILGSGDHRYAVYHDWGELPSKISYGNTHGVKTDSNGLIYIHHTVHKNSVSDHSVVVYDPKGKFVTSWGGEFAGGAHGLHINKEGSEEFLYFCDIRRNIVVKTDLKGNHVMTLGYPSESEAYKPKAGMLPRYRPTNLAIASNGDIYVGDGYGSSYVSQYDKNGNFVRSFGGGKTDSAGDLNVPHGIMIDERGGKEELLVADRSNKRLQYFALDGKHSRFVANVDLPCHFDIYKNGDLLIPDLARRVTILDKNNNLAVHLGEGLDDWGERRKKSRDHFLRGKFICPHGACYDREGNIFVVEWVEIGRVTKLQKVA
jgi:sugar lactone lactonase YvrE